MHAVMAALDAFKPHKPEARQWVEALSELDNADWGEVFDSVSNSNEVQLCGCSPAWSAANTLCW